jgi:hypothetical protein
VLVGVAVCSGSYQQYRKSRLRLKTSNRLYEHIAALEPSKEKLFVCWAAAFPYEALRPFARVLVPSELRLLPLGWPQRTAHYRAMKEQFHIGDLAGAIYRRDDVHVIGDRYSFELYRQYVREHYAAEVQYDVNPSTSLFAVMQARESQADERESERLAGPMSRDSKIH